ncbi:MAG: hypothetical protein GF307_09830, partial [candidate division Zixibacteria bacterium]|nr:hypothetical protein [candidate division Zixibacteria bacterium]
MFRRKIIYIIGLISLLAYSGCTDSSDPVTPQEEHYEAVGLVIYSSGVPVLDYYGPDYNAGDDVAYLDTLEISQGLNPHWDLQFYAEDGSLQDPPDDADKSFGAEFADPSIAELWWHEGEEGEFAFHIRGLRAGQTTAEFKVYHNDHADFSTLPIPLVVDTTVLHDAPIGVNLYDEESDSLLATAYLEDSNIVTGSLMVTANEETDHIVAQFFDQYGVEFWPGVPPHSLVVESSDTTIAAVTGQQPDEPWAFKLQGNSSGNCEITVYIYHDGSVGKTFT